WKVLEDRLATDLGRLTVSLRAVCESHRAYRDYGDRELRDALAAVICGLPVYRTYVRPGVAPSPRDVELVDLAVGWAKARMPEIDARLFDLLRAILTGSYAGRDAD